MQPLSRLTPSLNRVRPIGLLIACLSISACAGTQLREWVAPEKIEWQNPAEVRAARRNGEPAPNAAASSQPAVSAQVDTAHTGGGELAEAPPLETLIRSLEENDGVPQPPKIHEASLEKQDAPESLWDRIIAGFAMPELNSPLVAKKEQQYLAQPEYMQRMMMRGSRYLYHIVEEIERRGMPTELALLPFVESAMNPTAMSHAKAAGLWQFIPSTGRAYDLKQNWWADYRRDVVQSTRAALDYLQMLHKMHNGDWFLALASYNWGEGSVNRAVKANAQRGRPTDYLSLRMPLETQHYVPKLIALKNILHNAAQHNLTLPELPNEPYFVVLERTRPIDLDLAAKFAGMSVKDFVALNPAHNRPVIFASSKNMFKIPTANLDQFLAAMEEHEESGKAFVSWRPYTLRKNETIDSVAKRLGTTGAALLSANGLSAKRRIVAGTSILVPSNKASGEHIAKFAGPRVVEEIHKPAVYHRVRKRDTLTRIARSWGLSTRKLKQWNGLSGNKVRSGQRLLVRQPLHQTIETTAAGDRKIIARHATPSLRYSASSQHLVRGGDTLGAIAQRYGVSTGQLQSWNKISGSRIHIGQRLQVKAAQTFAAAQRTAEPSANNSDTEQTSYRVRSGDSLIRIARRHQVSPADLKRWNKLSGSSIQAGQQLLVSESVTKKTSSKKTLPGTVKASTHRVRSGDSLIRIASVYGMTVPQVQQLNGLKGNHIQIGQTLRVSASAKRTAPKAATKRNKVRHQVRKGDTLIAIARRYGVSVADIRSWNSLRSDSIRYGQRLTIQTTGSENSAQIRESGDAKRG